MLVLSGSVAFPNTAMKLEVVGGFILFMVAALWIWPLVSWLSVGSKAEVFRVPPLGHLSFAVAFAIFDGFRAGSQVFWSILSSYAASTFASS